MAVSGCCCRGGSTAYIAVPPVEHAGLSATEPIVRSESSDTVVHARFTHVSFHVWPGVALQLADLRTRLRSRRPDGVVSFDDPRSFVVDIDDGTVGLDMADLSRLMNTYVFAYRGAPLRDLEFTVRDGHLVQRGVLHKVVDIPFEMVGDVSLTTDGEIRVHPVSMKICSIDGKGLMNALGITLARLLDVSKAKGVRVDRNDLLLDPQKLLPPPAIHGRLTSVAVAPGMLVQRFGGSLATDPPPMQPDSAAANYMMFRGGTLQFGKLFMVHSDMEVVDLTPGDPLDFDINRYHEQLVAGYHRTLADDALLVFMPDVDKLAKGQ